MVTRISHTNQGENTQNSFFYATQSRGQREQFQYLPIEMLSPLSIYFCLQKPSECQIGKDIQFGYEICLQKSYQYNISCGVDDSQFFFLNLCWYLHICGQTKSLKKPDDVPCHVKLPPLQAVSGRELKCVVVVVPSLPKCKQCHPPSPTNITCLISTSTLLEIKFLVIDGSRTNFPKYLATIFKAFMT